jgi:predicted transcriptional regulator
MTPADILHRADVMRRRAHAHTCQARLLADHPVAFTDRERRYYDLRARNEREEAEVAADIADRLEADAAELDCATCLGIGEVGVAYEALTNSWVTERCNDCLGTGAPVLHLIDGEAS